MTSAGAVLSRRRTASVWPLRLARLLPYLFLLAAAYSVFAETVDDPYITFRYAANLLAGQGPVFNPGERVEGFTSPLHLLLSALLLSVAPSVDILFKAKCVSLLFAFVMLAQTGTLARRSGLNGWESVLAQSLVALNINFALAGVNALETTLYGSILLAALLVFHREVQRGQGYASGALLFLASLARPEALLLVAALAGVRWYRQRCTHLSFRFLAAWLGAFLVPTVLFEAVRFGYYGQLLPNTYFAKAQPLWVSLSRGAAYPLRATAPRAADVPAFLHDLALLSPHTLLAFHSLAQKNLRSDLFSLFMPLLFWGLALLGFWRIKHRVMGGISLAVVGATLLFVLKAGGDWMYGWRFMVPVLPLLAVCQCFAVRAISRRLARRFALLPARRSAAVCGGIVALLWLVSCTKTEHYSWKSAGFSTQGVRLLEASDSYGPLWVQGANYIKRFPPGTKVAYSEMGYAGYLNLDKYMLDIRGLTDRQIAHLPPQFKYSTGVADKNWYVPGDPLNAILERRKPDVIISFDPAASGTVLSGYRQGKTLALPTHGGIPTPAYVFQRVSSRSR